MPVVVSIFLVLSLVLAVMFGPQTRPWTWGPSITALALAALAALPGFWRGRKFAADFGFIGLGLLTAGWFAWRASVSPVVEFAEADGILLAVAVAGFFVVRSMAGNTRAEGVLLAGIAILLGANCLIAGRQMIEVGYSALLPRRTDGLSATGFFTHYNEAANYFIASAMLVAAPALLGRHRLATRILLALLAIGGLVALYHTRSRGGWFGGMTALGVLSVLALIDGKRTKARWFPAAVVVVPILALGLGIGLFFGWENLQESRNQEGGVAGMMDNTIRLYLMGMALACTRLHWWTGGGSRSFSWESFQVWDRQAHGAGGTRPEYVHNELLQAAADYGVIGFILILSLLVVLMIQTLVRTAFEPLAEDDSNRSAWRIGATAALVGMLVQSCFSFVFHLLPGVVLLGICLGQISRPILKVRDLRGTGVAIIGSIASVSCALFLGFFGGKGIAVSRSLWDSYFGRPNLVSSESRIDALTTAIGIWPTSSLLLDRAEALHFAAGNVGDPDFEEFAMRAINDYQRAAELHPYDPVFPINEANLRSQLGQYDEAESLFMKAITLQGEMEPGFRGHYSIANHLLAKCVRLSSEGAAEPALNAIEKAAVHIEKACELTPPWVIGKVGFEIRVAIHENLGAMREAAGDREGAMEAYDFAVGLRDGRRVNYRAGVLFGRMAVDAWSQRRAAEALAYFMKARQRVTQAGNTLPNGVSASDRLEFITYLDRSIAFLKGARIVPAELK